MEGYHPELKVILDDGNYTYWKSRTRANIQCIDEAAWYLTEHGWKPPTVTVDGVTTDVPRERWTTAQRDEYKFNARALAQIHGSCSKKQFELIQGCTKSKEAWDIDILRLKTYRESFGHMDQQGRKQAKGARSSQQGSIDRAQEESIDLIRRASSIEHMQNELDRPMSTSTRSIPCRASSSIDPVLSQPFDQPAQMISQPFDLLGANRLRSNHSEPD
ncbi:unnamed protein product [Microthlaspi erraticum]|uniref:DUF4219 domain-containing protein n=1 Tax=Microthlaspi erraticum TaxID=1685480 RepID=A0A6D2HTA6_9BRAS|nr:unnamed protein product [Microthlaspi erraticum]